MSATQKGQPRPRCSGPRERTLLWRLWSGKNSTRACGPSLLHRRNLADDWQELRAGAAQTQAGRLLLTLCHASTDQRHSTGLVNVVSTWDSWDDCGFGCRVCKLPVTKRHHTADPGNVCLQQDSQDDTSRMQQQRLKSSKPLRHRGKTCPTTAVRTSARSFVVRQSTDSASKPTFPTR